MNDRSLFLKNTGILTERYSDFKEDIVDKYSPSSVLEVSEARDGQLTAKIDNLWIHSSRAPLKEAEKLVVNNIKGRSGLCIVLGFGFGYHIEYLQRMHPEMDILVVEHDPSLFLESLHYRDFSSLLGSSKTGFLFDISPATLSSVLPDYQTTNINILRLRPLYERSHEYYSEIDDAISSFQRKRETNMNTLNRFGKVWIKNLFRNIEIFQKAADAGIVYGRFTGMPALVIAAGPSLDTLLPHLKELRERCVLICVDTALRAVLKTGTVPDFIVVVDPQYLNTRHLDNLLDIKSDSAGPLLVSESSTHPAVFRNSSLPVLFFRSIFPLGKMIERTAGISSEIGAGGSVATTAWDLARRLGCSRIYTAGLDLGYPEKNTHCRTSLSSLYTEMQAYRLSPSDTISFAGLQNASPCHEINNSGGTTLTDKRLIIYKWWFEGQLQADSSEKRFFNLSRYGIKINGMDFAEISTLLSYDKCRDEIDRIFDSISAERRQNSCKTAQGPAAQDTEIIIIIKSLITECFRLENVCAEALKILDAGRTLDFKSAEYASEMRKLSELDSRISQSPSKELSEFIIQPVLNSILNEDNSAFDNSNLLYSTILDSCRYHRIHAERALKRMGIG